MNLSILAIYQKAQKAFIRKFILKLNLKNLNHFQKIYTVRQIGFGLFLEMNNLLTIQKTVFGYLLHSLYLKLRPKNLIHKMFYL